MSQFATPPSPSSAPSSAPHTTPPRAPAWRCSVAFTALFVCYQLPEGLHIYELMLLVLPVAWLCGRFLGYRGFDAWYLSRSPRWLTLLIAAFVLAGCPLWPAVGLHWGWNFANSVADSAFQIDRVGAVGGPLMSAFAHLILFILILDSAPKLFRSGSYRSVMP